jgi:hypothetical protein
MDSSKTLRVVLGEPIGPISRRAYIAGLVYLLSVVAVSLAKNTVITMLAVCSFFVLGIVGAVFSRTTITVTFNEIVIRSRGIWEPAFRVPLAQVRAASVQPGPALEIVTVTGETKRFGPWQRLTPTSQAHLAKCQRVVSAIAERVPLA